MLIVIVSLSLAQTRTLMDPLLYIDLITRACKITRSHCGELMFAADKNIFLTFTFYCLRQPCWWRKKTQSLQWRAIRDDNTMSKPRSCQPIRGQNRGLWPIRGRGWCPRVPGAVTATNGTTQSSTIQADNKYGWKLLWGIILCLISVSGQKGISKHFYFHKYSGQDKQIFPV